MTWWPETTLTGETVELRPLRAGDEAALFAVTAPGTMRHFLDWPGEWTPEAFSRWLWGRAGRANQRAFAVVERSSGSVVGSTAFMDIDEPSRSVEIGSTWYAERARGTRVNPESKLLLLGHAFGAQGCQRVTLKCDARNVVSQRAIAGIGAVREGVLRRQRAQPDGFLRDTVYFSILREEWPGVEALLRGRLSGRGSAGGFAVRSARAGDTREVLGLVAGICAQHEALDPERFAFRGDVLERYERWLPERAADARSVYLVAEGGGRVVGYIVCTMEPDVPIYWTPESGWMHDLFVEPSWRGRGVARALVTEAVRRLGAIGARRIRLETAEANGSARALFAGCGFRPSTREMMLVLQPPARGGASGASSAE